MEPHAYQRYATKQVSLWRRKEGIVRAAPRPGTHKPGKSKRAAKKGKCK